MYNYEPIILNYSGYGWVTVRGGTIQYRDFDAVIYPTQESVTLTGSNFVWSWEYNGHNEWIMQSITVNAHYVREIDVYFHEKQVFNLTIGNNSGDLDIVLSGYNISPSSGEWSVTPFRVEAPARVENVVPELVTLGVRNVSRYSYWYSVFFDTGILLPGEIISFSRELRNADDFIVIFERR